MFRERHIILKAALVLSAALVAVSLLLSGAWLGALGVAAATVATVGLIDLLFELAAWRAVLPDDADVFPASAVLDTLTRWRARNESDGYVRLVLEGGDEIPLSPGERVLLDIAMNTPLKRADLQKVAYILDRHGLIPPTSVEAAMQASAAFREGMVRAYLVGRRKKARVEAG